MELRESVAAARRAHAEQCVEFPGPAGKLRGIVTPADSGALCVQPYAGGRGARARGRRLQHAAL
jgi:hypothetical protein